MQAHFLRYSCEIFTTKTCYVENKNIRLSIEKMRKMMLVMLRMRMCCCRISGGGSSNRLFTTGGFIIVPPSCTFILRPNILPFPFIFTPFPSSSFSSLTPLLFLAVPFILSSSSFSSFTLSYIFYHIFRISITIDSSFPPLISSLPIISIYCSFIFITLIIYFININLTIYVA